MKKIIVCIVGVVGVILLLVVTSNKNIDNTFKQDGVLFALTMDGDPISSFPDYSSGKYSIDINCSNNNAKVQYKPVKVRLDDDSYRYEWKLRVEKIKGNVTCNLDFSEKNVNTLKKQVEEIALAAGDVVNEGTAGYRYEGQNPDNYIWFNNEMWRIIGSIPTCTTASCGTSGSNLVKIIRKDSIGALAYDAQLDGYTGAWGSDATLYHLLNSVYWGKNDGTDGEYCYGFSNISKAKCDYTEIGLSANDYYGAMVKEVYWNTGESTEGAKLSRVYGNEVKKQTIQGHVGLMTASDYGYATNASHDSYLYQYNNATHTLGNWICNQGYEWTSIQSSLMPSITLYVYNDGSVTNAGASAANAVRPVVYLSASVYVVDGSGTESDPYIVGYMAS